jgi:hypothetical protein
VPRLSKKRRLPVGRPPGDAQLEGMAWSLIGANMRIDDPYWAREWVTAHARYPDSVPPPSQEAVIALGIVFARLEDEAASGLPVCKALDQFEHQLGLRSEGKGKKSPLDGCHRVASMTLRRGAVLTVMAEEGANEADAMTWVAEDHPELVVCP